MGKKYMIQLYGLRLMAVGAVMLGHWVNIESIKGINDILSQAGVDLFFVLSGFLITTILLTNKSTSTEGKGFLLKQFYVRRLRTVLYYISFFNFIHSQQVPFENIYRIGLPCCTIKSNGFCIY